MRPAYTAPASACGPRRRAVRDASTGWRQAAIKKDAAALGRYLADDLAYSHADGKTQSKAEYIASVTNSGRYESFTESDTNVRVY